MIIFIKKRLLRTSQRTSGITVRSRPSLSRPLSRWRPRARRACFIRLLVGHGLAFLNSNKFQETAQMLIKSPRPSPASSFDFEGRRRQLHLRLRPRPDREDKHRRGQDLRKLAPSEQLQQEVRPRPGPQPRQRKQPTRRQRKCQVPRRRPQGVQLPGQAHPRQEVGPLNHSSPAQFALVKSIIELCGKMFLYDSTLMNRNTDMKLDPGSIFCHLFIVVFTCGKASRPTSCLSPSSSSPSPPPTSQ